MANRIQCGLEQPGEDFCSCGCDPVSWCGNPECWTRHFGYPENHQEKLTANYKGESMRAADFPKSRPN